MQSFLLRVFVLVVRFSPWPYETSLLVEEFSLQERFVLQPVRLSPANGRPLHDCFFPTQLFLFSVFPQRVLPETVQTGRCFLDSNRTKKGVVLRACTSSRPSSLLSLRDVLESSDFSALPSGLQLSTLPSVKCEDYEFVPSYAFYHGSRYGLTSGVGFALFAQFVSGR